MIVRRGWCRFCLSNYHCPDCGSPCGYYGCKAAPGGEHRPEQRCQGADGSGFDHEPMRLSYEGWRYSGGTLPALSPPITARR